MTVLCAMTTMTQVMPWFASVIRGKWDDFTSSLTESNWETITQRLVNDSDKLYLFLEKWAGAWEDRSKNEKNELKKRFGNSHHFTKSLDKRICNNILKTFGKNSKCLDWQTLSRWQNEVANAFINDEVTTPEEPMKCIGYLRPEQAHLVVTVMASYVRTNATVQNPIIEGELPLDGSRFEGIIPPIVSNPIFVIRKKASAVFSLEQYVANGILPDTLIQNIGGSKKGFFDNAPVKATIKSLDFISRVIAGRENVLIVGSTGSGKTTLINAFGQTLSKVAAQDRLIIIEDTLEIQIESENVVFLRTSDFVDFRRLVRACMRLRPDRIIIGEVRDGAALDLLKAWNTGHPGGFATIHANSAYEGLTRLEELVEEATSAPKQRLIAAAIDLVVFIEKCGGSRKITEIARVKGYNQLTKQYELEYWLNRDLAF